MGAGGRMAVNPSTESRTENQKKRVPSSKPPFTLNDIKKAIPPHCFERSVIKSFYYLVHDLTIAYLLYYIGKTYIHQLPYPLSYLAWPVYWYLQGSFLTAVWIIGHECGHHAFSDYQLLDDTVGLILHSLLLTPYFSWKHSHRRHHANTGSMENDEVYVPKRKTSLKWYYKYLNNPLGRFIILTITLTLGWPTYLLFNVTGKNYDRYASHFYPYSPFYADRERLHIYISDAGILAVLYGLYRLVAAKGIAYMFSIYGVPLLLVNGFIVLITYLHHTHISLPHYNSSEWDWIRGALATCDRDYGTFLNHVLHNIADTHVLHHLFSSMPHYHAMEATKAMKPLLGEYYQYDGTPVYKAMWREAKQCIYVEPDEGDDQNTGVLWYKNKI